MTARFGASLGPSVQGLVRRHRPRLEALVKPEVIAGAAIAAVWAALASFAITPLPVVVAIIILSVTVHLAAVDSGNFALLWIATGWVLLLIIVSTRSVLGGGAPLAFTVAGVTALAHNDLIRMSHARRRDAVIDRSAVVAVTIGLGLAALVAVIGIGLSDSIVGGDERSWLWVPVAAAAVGALAIAFVVAPAWRAPEPNKERWQPGDRIPPHRIATDGSATSGLPPTEPRL